MDTTDWPYTHISRHFEGNAMEESCPCPQEPCGFVDVNKVSPDCTQHPFWAGKTIRRAHSPAECPAATSAT